MINKYFTDFGNIINSLDFIVSLDIHERKVNDFQGIIEGKLIFDNGILETLEVVKVTDDRIFKKKYKYHFRNQSR
jgi:hypothetical protein